MEKFLVNHLYLVYPPISNREATWLSTSKDARTVMDTSKLYFIAQRKEMFFKNWKFFNQDASMLKDTSIPLNDKSCPIWKISFDLISDDHIENNLFIEFESTTKWDDETRPLIELGDKFIRIWKNEEKKDILFWSTPDMLLYNHWNKEIIIQGLNSVRPFTHFKLHYIGISKKNDSMTRLFEEAHNRSKILSLENTFNENSHISDEIMIFLFDISEIGIKTLSSYDSSEELLKFTEGIISPAPYDKVMLISDAEKAFVKLLDSTYNEVKYAGYPKSKDGLYNEMLTRYGFSISECISFETEKLTFTGDKSNWGKLSGPMADLIVIENNNVDYVRSDYLRAKSETSARHTSSDSRERSKRQNYKDKKIKR